MTDPNQFRFSIDRGGTFTDVYAEVPGEPGFKVIKLLSVDPASYDDAPREGIRRILQEFGEKGDGSEIDASRIEWVRMGTTVATNALLERKGARCALVVTKGFGDILQIGTQEREDLFDLQIRQPERLYEEVVEVDERLRLIRQDEKVDCDVEIIEGITGERFEVCKKPDLEVLRPQFQDLLDRGITSLGIVFLHAYGCPQHEQMVGSLASELGFSQISLSSTVMPMVKMVSRGDTTMVDSYLTPHIHTYLKSFKRGFKNGLSDAKLLFMQSDGGLTRGSGFTGSRAILSGPAAGVVGYAMTTYNRKTKQPVIGFDMGGTSTDVSRYGGEYDLTFETTTAGVRIQAPQLDIRTVAAGGGSRLFFENGMFLVGPESAGAHPGPICYRKNGSLSVTDANLVLGRLQPDYFPKIFGPNEDQCLDKKGAFDKMEQLTREINDHYKKSGRPELTVEEVALGYIKVANEVMVRPIREVSVMRGFDIKEHVLATFGGAGGQHACAIARNLGIQTLFIHRFSGILSAYGLNLADVVKEVRQPAAEELNDGAMQQLLERLSDLQCRAEKELEEQGYVVESVRTKRYLNLRYQGSDTPLMIEEPDDGDFQKAFELAFRREFGFGSPNRQIVVDDLRVRSTGQGSPRLVPSITEVTGQSQKQTSVRCYFDGKYHQTDLYKMDDLKVGQKIVGPAILIQDTSTIIVEPDCSACITGSGDVEIQVGLQKQNQFETTVDPVQLTIFSNLFMSIAEQMGRMLQKTAVSTNIKERLDFSCALFDQNGNLVANAPHVPVHLGAMSYAIKEQIRLCPTIEPGDVLVSNHPAAGGSHLPDITVMTPVFSGDLIIFWVANRGHHADVGGISPGSMPADSQDLSEEGAAILSFKLVSGGAFQQDRISELLLAPGTVPPKEGRPAISGARQLADNISDLKAQVAANQKGIELILEMVAAHGIEVVQAYMGYIQNTAEHAVRSRLRQFSQDMGLAPVDTVTATEKLDDGSPIVLTITIDRRDGSATFDFRGTGAEVCTNLNTPRAVTQSAILYSLRCLVQKEIPLNHGCLIPITLIIPAGSLLDPTLTAPVAGGNVLTSQRIVDVVLKAFGAAAGSQGCMNNFTFGNEKFGYYETIGGGAGAGPNWHGRSGVHTHMTNTRITDPEILERRYPVLLREFSVRRGSGGAGRYRGGDGLVREFEFLQPLKVTILSERRVFPPYGMAGGQPGGLGENLLISKNGKTFILGGKREVQVETGDKVRILTPGGGGYGQPPSSKSCI